jgi:hypothetical protein
MLLVLGQGLGRIRVSEERHTSHGDWSGCTAWSPAARLQHVRAERTRSAHTLRDGRRAEWLLLAA